MGQIIATKDICQVLNYFVIDTIEVDSAILGVRSKSALQNLLLLSDPKKFLERGENAKK